MSKKVVNLTKSNLKDIVKKIVSEQIASPQTPIIPKSKQSLASQLGGEKDAEALWASSKSWQEFEQKMVNKGYTTEDAKEWSRTMAQRHGIKFDDGTVDPSAKFITKVSNDNTFDFSESVKSILSKYNFKAAWGGSNGDEDTYKHKYTLNFGNNEFINVVPYLCDKSRIGVKVWDSRNTKPRKICGDASAAIETKLEKFIQYMLNPQNNPINTVNKIAQNFQNQTDTKMKSYLNQANADYQKYKQPINEQQPIGYRVGQILKGKRSVDNQMYTIKIIQTGDGIVVAKIKGPGSYHENGQENPIDGTGTYELQSRTPGELGGNKFMGSFKIINGINENIKRKKIIRLTESDLKKYIQKVLSEQPVAPFSPNKSSILSKPEDFGVKNMVKQVNQNAERQKRLPIQGGPDFYLKNNSPQLNTALGILPENLGPCFKYGQESNTPSSFGVGDSEIKEYVDCLGVYGNVPGTSIPIPYQGNDLNEMIQLLQGGSHYSQNFGIYGSLKERTGKMGDGKIYPAVEIIRAYYQQEAGKSLLQSLQRRSLDQDQDIERKEHIYTLLMDAYKTWIDCANGDKEDV